MPVSNIYNVKLFGYPKFINELEGYKIVWYLYNLDRNVVFDVTNLVRFNVNSGAFRPTLYGSVQRLSVNINLKEVSGSFKSFVHAQTIDITLYTSPNDVSTSWTIAYEPNQIPAYGVGLFATVREIEVNKLDINLAASFTFEPTLTLEDKFNLFIEKLVSKTKPIYNVNNEISYPMPTHFTINSNGVEQDYPIANWNTPIRFTSTVKQHDTLIVKFYKQTPMGKIHITASGIEVRYIL